MTEIKTKLGENDAASTPFRPATGIAESNVQEAIETTYAAIATIAAAAIATHEAAANPHPVYLTEAEGDAAYDALGAAAAAVAAHEAAANPHPTYLTQAEGDALYEALGHTHPASEISDSTAAGRTLLTATDAAAQRTALGLATIATSASASDLSAGTVPDARMPAHTGDVTSSVGTVALTIANDAVTNAKLADMAANAVKCRAASSTGDPSDVALSASQLLGRGSTGDVAAISLGTNLSMSGTTLNASGGGSATPSAPQGRLTLTSGEPVTTADVTAATTVYYAPYEGRYAPFFDGSAWAMADVGGELSQALSDTTKSPAASAADSNYDLFLWNDGGTYRCTRGPAWSSATSRGTGAGTTELARVQGRLVNNVAITNGPEAQRGTYVGTIRTTSSNQCEDSATKRLVWNAYNRRKRALSLPITTDSWTYSTATWRQVQGSTTYQIAIVVGLNEDAVDVTYRATVGNSTTTTRTMRAGIGLDSTTAFSGYMEFIAINNQSGQADGHFCDLIGLGFHFLAALEMGAGVDTQTWYGDANLPLVLISGMFGHCYS